MNKRNIVLVILGLMVVVSLNGCGQAQPNNTNTATNNTVGPTSIENKWVGLAKALTTAGAKMYGAFWCSHCQEQKKDFGDAFQYVTYIECAPDTQDPYKQAASCKAAKIEGYPTWIFADGSRVDRVMSFDELAKKIGYQATP